MSLLEDLFLEDEAGEAQELERVIEGGGDDYDERPGSPNSDDNEERDDEAVEDKRRVDPSKAKEKRVIKNPRFVLNPARLTGPRGIQVIPDHYKDFKFKGKGHEKEDLDMVLKKLEHWAYRLYPKFAFHDCLKKIETLGRKRPVMVHLQKIRSDQYLSEETVVQRDSSDDEAPAPVEDEFDKLLQQQIELARSTPAPNSVKKPAFATPSVDRSHIMPKATSSPSISDEQRERMLRNRRMAEERRLAKLRDDSSSTDITSTPKKHSSIEGIDGSNVNITNDVVIRKHNRSNIIDSSDEEDTTAVNESITIDVDVHKEVQKSDVIELIDSQNTINKQVNEVVEILDDRVVRKHNRSNVMDSSDVVSTEDTVPKKVSNSDIIDLQYDTFKNKSVDKEINKNQVVEIMDDVVIRKHNRSRGNDSSDEEDLAIVNESVTVDVDIHKKVDKGHDVEIINSPMNKTKTDVIQIDTEISEPNNYDNIIAMSDINKDSNKAVNNVNSEDIVPEISKESVIVADDEVMENDNLIK